MLDQKLIRCGLLYQWGAGLYCRMLKLRYPRACAERFVDTSRGPVRVLEYGFDAAEPAPLYVDLHGGGFIMQTADADRRMNLCIREKTPVKIISIDYPKAPQQAYPAAIEAAYEVVLHYAQSADRLGIMPGSMGIGGHSAGANLAAVLCIRAKERGDLAFRYQILDYPVTDMSLTQRPQVKGALSPRMTEVFKACYTGGDEEILKSPDLSPVYASREQLCGLPPAMVIVAGRDSLHDEGLRYAGMLEDAGVPVTLDDYPNALHGFTQFSGEDSRRAIDRMAAFIARHS